MIDRILDKYYTKKLTKRIEDRILSDYNLDLEIEIDDKEVNILCKPRKHKDYTHIYSFYESEAFIKLIEFDFIYEKIIEDTIKYLDENNYWR